MQLFYDQRITSLVQDKYIFLDNDFLSLLFTNEEAFREAYSCLAGSYFLLDSLTIFEFLRNIFVPKERKIREKFLASSLGNTSVFFLATDHNDIYIKTRENALILSKIYAHQGINGNKKSGGPGPIDLFLAAKLMIYSKRNHLLITGNKKDFPTVIFDTLSILNIEDKNSGTMRCYSLVSFNQEKFDDCFEKLNDLKV
ncbi:MAG TPA: hypothetical protein VD999_03145 [Vitreimonas sp.]|nr:hypothetical protein [Vitreimonas sp.]